LNLPGGTIVAAIEELKKRGADHRLMRVVSINYNPETGSEKCNASVLVV
jgi:multimeric flavodoxin WrbA